jgi:23S rRNA (pseudouridine1915-N3)-methyltransferase
MFSFHLIAVSQHPAGPWEELVLEYTKRLSGFAKITTTYVKPEKILPSVGKQQILNLEGERILKAVKPDSVLIVCDEFGKLYTTVEFVRELQRWSVQQTQTITFVIGGPLGLSDAVKQAATLKLALSHWTLPHDLAAVVLIEQLYRAMTIEHGKTYHY